MAQIFDAGTGFPVADPERQPFPPDYSFDKSRLDFSSFILSASGWRKVFASDSNEESCVSSISIDDRERIILIAHVLSGFFKKKKPSGNVCIAVGIDTRYTGPVIADILIRTLLADSIEVRYLFIAAAPEIMAYTKKTVSIDGFAYVSASHNPVGHNGLKFGLADGAVLGGTESADLIRDLLVSAETASGMKTVIEKILGLPSAVIRKTYESVEENKAHAVQVYADFSREVISGFSSAEEQASCFNTLMNAFKVKPVGVVSDMNGSARTVSIDREFLRDSGILFESINALPRQIIHRIVPEGESLLDCARFLENKYSENRAFCFGYVPDNDGDRGNLVYIDRDGKACILEAQEVFALVCVSEIAWLVYSDILHYNPDDKAHERAAIVVNGPTSLRIEHIAQAFDVRVFRAEVGEANVVSLAADLRKSGYIVRVLGEGSNGGNITFPSSVRDPINTVFSILKILSIGSNADRPGLFDIWRTRAGLPHSAPDSISIADIIETLPCFTTTSAFEDRARMTIRTKDHGELKARYEAIFDREWDRRKDLLRDRYGIYFREEVVYQGASETRGTDLVRKSGKTRGGLKMLFKDKNGKQIGFIWMRGSGTEPVFRIMADFHGRNPEAEAYLLDWQRSMILEADS